MTATHLHGVIAGSKMPNRDRSPDLKNKGSGGINSSQWCLD